jgi:hypothetical protein
MGVTYTEYSCSTPRHRGLCAPSQYITCTKGGRERPWYEYEGRRNYASKLSDKRW